jgi:gamma-glutamylputrescine oxidase
MAGPPSFWFTRGATSEEADVVVVGGGLLGAATAWWAAREGHRVLLLEAHRVASGATGRGPGLLLTGGREPFVELASRVGECRALRLWELSRESVGLLRRELLEPARIECGWRPEPSWRTARAGSEAERQWQASAERLAREGFAVEWRDAAATRAAAASPALGGALRCAEDGAIDPVALCRGLLAQAAVQVREAVAVRQLEPMGERVRLGWEGGEVVARAAVLALNASSAPLVPPLAPRLRAVGMEALAAAATPRRLNGLWMVDGEGTAGREAVSLRQLDDGTVIAAAHPGAGAEAGFLDLPTAAGQAGLEGSLHALFPALGRPAVRHRWAGTVTQTADGLPAIGAVPATSAAAYGCASDGNGSAIAFLLGRQLARWAGDRDEGHLALFEPAAAQA